MADKRANALIIKGGKILLIHRIKGGKEYFVLPGGSVEKDESIARAAVREAKEETGLAVVVIDKELWKYHNNADDRDHHYFLVTKYSGKLRLGSPEINRVSKTNKYFLEWRDLNELKDIKLFPEKIKMKIIETFSGRRD